jgi:mono/diheme cytochrome c family protein
VADLGKPAAPAPKPPEVGKEPAPPPPAQMATPQLYRAYCLACHDADGRGGIIKKAMPEIPDFADLKWQAGRSDADLGKAILEGKGKFMLPMKDKLAAEDVGRMVKFVREFQDGKQLVKDEPLPPKPPEKPPEPPVPPPPFPERELPPRVDPEELAAQRRIASFLYRQYCLSCHGTNGAGAELKASMPTLPDLRDRRWQEEHTDVQLAVSIFEGKGTLMPAFRGRVRDDQMPALVAYLRAFGPSPPPGVVKTPKTDFEERYRRLEDEWNALQKQLEELSRKRKP